VPAIKTARPGLPARRLERRPSGNNGRPTRCSIRRRAGGRRAVHPGRRQGNTFTDLHLHLQPKIAASGRCGGWTSRRPTTSVQ
jgi:hypothetical protein